MDGEPSSDIVTSGSDRLDTERELALAGRLSGLLWVSGALVVSLCLAVFPAGSERGWPLALLIAAALLWGATMLRGLPVRDGLAAALHLSTLLSLPAIAIAVHLTGGPPAPAEHLLWFPVVYAALFFRPAQAAGYWVGAGLVHAAPLLYDDRLPRELLARDLVAIVPAYFVVGGIVVAARELLARASARAVELEHPEHRLAEERSSLQRVATAVRAGSPPEAIFALVASEAGRLLGAGGAGIWRFLDAERAHLLATWSAEGAARAEPGAAVHGTLQRELGNLRASRCTIRVKGGLAAPIHSGTEVWGALAVTSPATGLPSPEDAARLAAYAEMVVTAVVSAEERGRNGAAAATDPATGLLNGRAFLLRLDEELSRARRHDRPLTLAMIDVDRFRELRDRAGDETAQAALTEVATLIAAAVRDEDVVARLDEDEFAVLFVEGDRHAALLATERARQAIARTRFRHGLRATVSAGLCDLEAATTVGDLLRRAGSALHWAKEHDRDRCWIYDPAVTRELELREPSRRLDRTHALVGLRALARAIDAKDPATHQHAERVAELARRLAVACGWAEPDVARLHDAAVLHDVGKIGVPDAILLKAGALDSAERLIIEEHPRLGAQIVGDVLDGEQVRWLCHHHERWDGRGYPDALRAEEIPEGARLLALADAFDAMTSPRVYRSALHIPEALEECRASAGAQFCPNAVRALLDVYRRDEPGMAAARVHRPQAAAQAGAGSAVSDP